MKREREKHITRLHIILFCLVVIAGVIVYTVIKFKINNSVVKYQELEKEVATAGELYFKINSIKLEDGYEKKINIKTLYNNHFLQNELVKKCKGYDLATSEKDGNKYSVNHMGYIKCGNKYESINYYEY